jgi:hypothetical protein
VSFAAITLFVLLLNECLLLLLLLLLFISSSTQSGNFWLHPCRMRVFENRALRKIFGPKREEMVGGWRKLHNEKRLTCTIHHILLG